MMHLVSSYSSTFLRIIRTSSRQNYDLFQLGNAAWSWIIALGIRKRFMIRPYRRSKWSYEVIPLHTHNFEENSPFEEGVISGAYQRPHKSFFQEPQELHSLVNTSNLVQKFLSKQADIDKIVKLIQKEVPKGTHLPVKIKEIQAGYLNSPYFKDIYLYLAQNKLPTFKAAIKKVGTLAEKYILLVSLLFKITLTPEKETMILVIPEICADIIINLYHSSW